MLQSYYGLYDHQLNGFSLIACEDRDTTADINADWWFDIQYDDMITDFEETFIMQSELSWEEYRDKKEKEWRNMDNHEFLENCDFEVVEITEDIFNMIENMNTFDNRLYIRLEDVQKHLNFNKAVHQRGYSDLVGAIGASLSLHGEQTKVVDCISAPYQAFIVVENQEGSTFTLTGEEVRNAERFGMRVDYPHGYFD